MNRGGLHRLIEIAKKHLPVELRKVDYLHYAVAGYAYGGNRRIWQ